MPTTTLRLPIELKKRVAKIAEKSGTTPHSLMLDAIALKVEEEELRTSFHEDCDIRFAQIIETGAGIPWHEMRAYLQTRAKGKPARIPRARRWRA